MQQGIAKVVEKHRARLGMSQEKLAELSGLSQTRISDLGLCRNMSTLETLYRLAFAFELEITVFGSEIEEER